MPDQKDKKPVEDRLTIPDTPAAISEHAPGTPGVKAEVVAGEAMRDKAKEALRADAEALRDRIMKLAADLEWHEYHDVYDEGRKGYALKVGEAVGMVDSEGEPLKEHIANSLLRTGVLLQVEGPEDLPEDIQSKLKAAAELVDKNVTEKTRETLDGVRADMAVRVAKYPDKSHEYTQDRIDDLTRLIEPSAIGAIKALTDAFEEKVFEIKAKIESNPDYLLDFKRGGSLREDLKDIINAMVDGQSHAAHLKTNCMVEGQPTIDHFPDIQDKWREMNERKSMELGREVFASEFEARFEMNEELRTEIFELIKKGEGSLEIAKRIPALMYGVVDIMCNCTASQLHAPFNEQNYELGNTDAESMATVLRALNQCLAAVIDINKTKKLIPKLA